MPLLRLIDDHFLGKLAILGALTPTEDPERLWTWSEELRALATTEPTLTPQDVAALHYARGMIRLRQGRERDAAAEFSRAVDAYPDPQQNRLAVVQLLRHYARTGQRTAFDELRARLFSRRPEPKGIRDLAARFDEPTRPRSDTPDGG